MTTTNTNFTFTSGSHTLTGTLVQPDGPGPHPTAVLITGSGPIDRDSNMKRQSLNVTRHLAEHLATAGIATLRYDKRGVGASDGDYHSSGFHDNVADARAAIDAIRAHADLGGVVAVGHSEGALIATRLAATGAAIDGAVLLAGSARSGEDILRHQAIIASEAVPAFARALLKLFRTDVHKLQAKRIAQLKGTSRDSMRIQGVKVNVKWFREFMAYNPADDLPLVSLPLLAITGKKDLQVPFEDLEVMAATAGGPIETSSPDNLTHILRNDPDEASLKAYRKLMQLPTDHALMEKVADWIEATVSQARSSSA